MAEDLYVKGLPELMKFLDDFPKKMQNNVVRSMLRAGGNVFKDRAQQELAANESVETGELSKGIKVGTKVKGDQVIASVRTTGPHGYVAHWVEFGTAAHLIVANAAKDIEIGAQFVHAVHHPGAHPKPYMRPALDTGAAAAMAAAASKLKERLTTQGLDVQDIDT